ncbi:MAG: CARDB domain-containing protein [Micropepsaceae bacterium]
MKRILLASAVFAAMSATASAGIDLVADFDANTGTVKVTNIGDAAASISVVTIECKRRKPAPPRGGGGCPDPGPAGAPYEMPAYPNKAAVKVPMLAPGASYAHALAFFPALVFPSGVYAFKIRADDGNMVPESNEANNNKTVMKTVP